MVGISITVIWAFGEDWKEIPIFKKSKKELPEVRVTGN